MATRDFKNTIKIIPSENSQNNIHNNVFFILIAEYSNSSINLLLIIIKYAIKMVKLRNVFKSIQKP